MEVAKVNKSKRIKVAKDPAEIHDKKNDRLISSKVLTITSIVLVVILVGALIFDQVYESPLIKVDGKSYTLHDLSFYFYNSEMQATYFDQIFGGNGSYWDMTYDEATGTTVGEFAREQTVNDAVKNEVLYNQAVSEGYSLTEDEKKTVDKNVSGILDTASNKAVIEKNNFTKAYLTDIIGKTTLVTRYRQDKIDALDIDDAAIKAKIPYEEHRQYDIEYLFASKKNIDDKGNSTDKSEADKTAALNKLTSYYETAKTTKDWSKFLPEDEKIVTYKSDNFIASDKPFDDKTKAKVMAMANDTVSDILEADDGYYIIRMKNNNSSENYDSAVKSAITDAESKGFDEVYQTILAKHKYKIYEKAVNKLKMGSVTLGN
jgi:foldase protein PrsA